MQQQRTGFREALQKGGMQTIARSQTTKELLIGNAYIQAKMQRYDDTAMRRQLDAARKHLAMELKLKFP